MHLDRNLGSTLGRQKNVPLACVQRKFGITKWFGQNIQELCQERKRT